MEEEKECGGKRGGAWSYMVGRGAAEGKLRIDVELVGQKLRGHGIAAGDEDGIHEGIGACIRTGGGSENGHATHHSASVVEKVS